ncbi:MAG: sugar ABC transporter substrate-binding protein [Opitutales bacterium]
MKSRIALVVLSLALSVLIGLSVHRGSGDGLRPAHRRPVIGFSMDTLKEERWQSDRDLFVARARELGAEVLVQSANSDDIRQLQDVDSLISNHVDALVIVPHDGAAMGKAVQQAHEAGIPVLAYDRLITGCNLDLYIAFDNVRVGELQARFLVDRFLGPDHPGAPKLRLVRIYGAKTDNNARLFKQGQDNMLDPLIASGRIEVVHQDWADDWKPENAKKIVNAAITQVGRNFDAILASNDGTAGGAIQALLEEGLAGKIVVTGQDADLAACQRIVAGTQAMTIYKPLKNLTRAAAELAFQLATRRPVVARDTVNNGSVDVPSVLLPVTVVTKENLASTVIADGLHTRERIYGQ